MGLSKEQITDLENKLVPALVSAFPTREELSLLVKRSLITELNEITQSYKSIEFVVDRIVSSARSKGKLIPLVIAASLKKPENPALKSLVKRQLDSLLLLECSDLLSDDMLLSLVKAFQPITLAHEFEELAIAACMKVLEDMESGVPELREQISSRASNPAKLLILFHLFLVKWESNKDKHLHIVLFVQNIAALVTEGAQTGLTQWLDDLPDELRPLPIEIVSGLYTDRPEDEALKTLKAYFIVTVEPSITSEDYGLKGYLITRLGNEKRYTKVETIALEVHTSQEKKESLKGKPEEVLKELQSAFPDWLVNVRQKISAQELDIKTSYRLEDAPISDITIEFWLPVEHLSVATETLSIYAVPVRRKRLTKVLGHEYKVLIRSYDRLDDAEARSNLERTWQKIKLHDQNVASSTEASEDIYCLDCWRQQPALEAQVQQSLVGLALTCPICAQRYEQPRNNFFDWMLDSGVPVVVWARALDLSDEQRVALGAEMQSWLATAKVAQLAPLFEQIWQARKHEGNTLALWCDEPERVIELKQFRDGGRLRA